MIALASTISTTRSNTDSLGVLFGYESRPLLPLAAQNVGFIEVQRPLGIFAHDV